MRMKRQMTAEKIIKEKKTKIKWVKRQQKIKEGQRIEEENR